MSAEPDDGAYNTLTIPDDSGAIPTSAEARAKRRIAALEGELQTMMEQRRSKKRFVINHFSYCFRVILIDPQRKTTYYVAQGRAIRRMVVLYTSVEDLIKENDRRCNEALEDDLAMNSTTE